MILRRLASTDSGSGTVGSLFALGLSVFLQRFGWPAQVAALVALTIASVWSSATFSRQGDPGWVVIDEAAGTLLATLGLGWPAVVVGWGIFRLADIFKRAFPGVAAAERLPSGWGITADDLVAGGYGLAAGWAVELILR